MKNTITFCLLFFSITLQAQEVKTLQFVPKFESETLVLHKEYILNGNKIKLSNFKFYISDLRYYYNDSLTYTSGQNIYLIDVLDSSSFYIYEKKGLNFNKIKFNIGIDSVTNTSGVMDGNLDPTTGMYWTWQSGYINFKLEGVASASPAKYNKFYWHIGGYKNPFNAQREVEINTKNTNFTIIEIQLAQLLARIDLSKLFQVMSPNTQSVQIANELSALFRIPQ